jgi:FecR protein
MNTSPIALFSTALMLVSLGSVPAAHVDIARNSVKAGGGVVRAGSSLGPDSSIATGSKSKTQITLGTNGSVLRAGSKTEAVLQNETDLALRQGVMLASSGKRALGREAVSVETPETKSTVKGTMLVAYQPRSYIKITCIEGHVTVKLKSLMGEFISLDAGQMVIINPAEKRLPQEVEVDLDELVRTSALVGNEFPELPSSPRLVRAVNRQARGISEGDAIRTPLVLNGAGLEVTLSNDRGINAHELSIEEAPTEPRVITPPRPAPETSPPPPPIVQPPPTPTGPEYVIDGTTIFSSASPILQTPGYRVIAGQPDPSFGPTLWQFADQDPNLTPELLIRGKVSVPSGSPAGDHYFARNLLVGDASGADVQQFGPLALEGDDSLILNSAQLATASGQSSSLNLISDRTIGIRNSTINQTGDVEATAPGITVDQSEVSAGNNLRLIGTGPAGILITNSSQLRTLATSAGLTLQTNGSPIAVRNSTITGNNVLIESGPSGNGPVEISNSTINADTIRARAFSSGGAISDALVISNSTFNANTVKLYAEGASKLVFDQGVNVNLPPSIGRAIFAGSTVEARSGANVQVNGNLDIYRDTANYNKAGFGNIRAGGQLSEQPYDARPNF